MTTFPLEFVIFSPIGIVERHASVYVVRSFKRLSCLSVVAALGGGQEVVLAPNKGGVRELGGYWTLESAA